MSFRKKEKEKIELVARPGVCFPNQENSKWQKKDIDFHLTDDPDGGDETSSKLFVRLPAVTAALPPTPPKPAARRSRSLVVAR